jgi:hypothetical protein
VKKDDELTEEVVETSEDEAPSIELVAEMPPGQPEGMGLEDPPTVALPPIPQVNSKRRHEGYFQVDHSASPGIPDELMPVGLPAGSGRGNFEAPCYTCNHCQKVVVLHPARTRDRAWCRYCDHYICDPCGAILARTGKCLPYTNFIELVQERNSRMSPEEIPDNGYEIQGGSTTQRTHIKEVMLGGQAGTSAPTLMMLGFNSTVAGTPAIGIAEDSPLDAATAALAAPVDVGTSAAIAPQRHVTLGQTLQLSVNAFGGVIRWLAAPGGAVGIVGQAANTGSVSLSAFTGGTPGLLSSHIHYETL